MKINRFTGQDGAMTTLQAHELELVGGRLCLDFVNTAAWQGTTCVLDHLAGYVDLVRWAHRAGILTTARAGALAAGASAGQDEVIEAALADARALRRACRGLLLPGAARHALDLAGVERALREPAAGLRLALAAGTPVHAGPDAPGAWLRLPVALSTIELATSADRQLVGCCPGERCGWLFLDRARRRRRVWCSMSTCGNRAKARAHYARLRHPPG